MLPCARSNRDQVVQNRYDERLDIEQEISNVAREHDPDGATIAAAGLMKVRFAVTSGQTVSSPAVISETETSSGRALNAAIRFPEWGRLLASDNARARNRTDACSSGRRLIKDPSTRVSWPNNCEKKNSQLVGNQQPGRRLPAPKVPR